MIYIWPKANVRGYYSRKEERQAQLQLKHAQGIAGLTGSLDFSPVRIHLNECCLGVGIPGWLFTADLQGNMNLFHLNSRSLIELPHVQTLESFDENHIEYEYYVEKALLSSDPHTTDDYILMINQGVPRSLAYWKPGKAAFTTVTHEGAYSDVTWHDGQFYGVDFQGNVIIFDFRGGLEPTSGRLVLQGVPSEFICGMQLYIVHSLGELFVITRDGIENHPETHTYGVKEFIVVKVDVDNETYEEVDDLGNRSLFLGFSASFADEQYGCKANHIYFTDDCSTAYRFTEKGGGKDMGVYNLFEDTIEPLHTGESYHRFSPPIWIFNTPITHLVHLYASSTLFSLFSFDFRSFNNKCKCVASASYLFVKIFMVGETCHVIVV